MALPHLQRQFSGVVPNLGAGATAPPSLPLPQAPWHPPVCTAHRSRLELLPWVYIKASPHPHSTRGSAAGPAAAQRALP